MLKHLRTQLVIWLLFFSLHADANFAIFQAANNSGGAVSTTDLMIGAGGNLSSISMAADGTMVVRTDTYGAYKWNPSAKAPNGTLGTWQQIVNVATMPVQFAANGQFFNDGVYEIQVCYSSSRIMYMMYLGYEQTGTLQSTV